MKPIIFNTEMIRAILDERKTQTRRIIKPQPEPAVDWLEWRNGKWQGYMQPGEPTVWKWINPYGIPGDKLWVKETWALQADLDTQLKEDGLTPGQITNEGYHIGYKADGSGVYPKAKLGKFRSPRFMPKWASRITLEIKDVRVGRVQDISVNDIVAEGLIETDFVSFAGLWDSINLKRGYGWDTNCYVWVIEFEKI